MAWFLLLAGVLLAFALALLLVPLLRGHPGGRAHAGLAQRLRALDAARDAGIIDADEYAAKRALLDAPAHTPAHAGPVRRSRAGIVAALAIALLMPASAIVLYRIVGAPQALSPQPASATAPGTGGDHGMDMEQAIAGLAARLEAEPDDAEGWGLLGRAYQTTQRFAEARDAFRHAHELQPDDAELSLAYAQAIALATPERRLDGESRTLIDAVLKADPANQRGLWLLGISEYQSGRYAEAIAAWNRLLPQLEAGSDIAQSVRNQIADAEALASGKPLPEREVAASSASAESAPPPAAGATAPSAGDSPQLHVSVRLDPALASKVAPGDALFVYARAAEGPPMPLAIQRLTADRLPIDLTLDDSMGMLPTMKLSMFPQVIVGARISRSGNAIAQRGDLQTLSAPVDVHARRAIVLTIDQVVP
jgi:cytochrome c-type biogenesis protein CcmH